MKGYSLKKGLLWGCVGSVLTLIGDILLGANPAYAAPTGALLVDMLSDCLRAQDLRLVIGGMLGVVGIPITALGYAALAVIIAPVQRGMTKVYRFAVLAFAAFAGAGVHLSCAAVPLLYKWVADADPSLACLIAQRCTVYFVIPLIVLFGVPLFLALAWQAIVFARGCTAYPRHAAFYNMAVGAAAGYLLAGVIGSNVVGNAVGTGAISIGHLWMFGMLLWKLPREYQGCVAD